MIPWQLIDKVTVPGDEGALQLFRRGEEYSIRLTGRGELMNSRVHGSEDALAELASTRLNSTGHQHVLIGGLGMGFTAAAALKYFGDQVKIIIAELVPAVVAWNYGPLGQQADYPLKDSRVTVREVDVAEIIKAEQKTFDAILLDVDNGPEGLTRQQNDWLYTIDGLSAAYQALQPGGLLVVWSAGPAPDFMQKLLKTGFEVEEKRVRAHGSKGARHVIWLAQNKDQAAK